MKMTFLAVTTQHKKFVLQFYPNFFRAKTLFKLGTFGEIIKQKGGKYHGL